MRIGNIKICKNVVKGFTAGTGLGLFIGGLCTHIFYRNRINRLLDNLCDDIEFEYFVGDGDEEINPLRNPLEDSDARKNTIIQELKNDSVKKFYNEDPRLEGCTPEDYVEDDESEPDDDVVYVNVFDDYKDSVVIAEELHGGEPYLITRKEYLETCLDFNKDTLGYYVDNEILIDDNGDVIEDPEDWVGKNGVSLFGKGEEVYDNGDTIYIRNPWKHADFELVRYFDEYKEGRV